jgi:hypothetical protein
VDKIKKRLTRENSKESKPFRKAWRKPSAYLTRNNKPISILQANNGAFYGS